MRSFHMDGLPVGCGFGRSGVVAGVVAGLVERPSNPCLRLCFYAAC